MLTAPNPALFGDYELLEPPETERKMSMDMLKMLLAGGFVKGYRTQIFGSLVALTAVAGWAVGDFGLTELLAKLPAILGGLGLMALGAKVNNAVKTEVETTKAAVSDAN